ncbi:MAG TPA: vanadium-dependent haloperoxidase [Solirubrobacteraceae bacterium]
MRVAHAVLLVAVLGLTAGSPAHAKKPRPAPCPGGRFLLGSQAFDGAVAAPPAVVVQGTQVSVDGACAPTTGTLRTARKGTIVRARWQGCIGVFGPVRLAARFDDACAELKGTLVARRAKPRLRRFVGHSTLCGDGIVDAVVGEQCEGAVACEDGAPCTDRCRCELPAPGAPSVARQWDEEALAAIRRDLPRPPVHARNLFHFSVAMWDAWAAYDTTAAGYLTTERHTSSDPEADRAEAISFAAYRVLSARYANAIGSAASLASFDARMDALGYDRTFVSTDGDSPAAAGNRIAAAVLAYGLGDGAREATNYDDPTYTPVNEPLIVKQPGTTMVDPNRWQPLALDFTVTQNGIPLPDKVQTAVCSHWGAVRPFAGTLPSDDPGPPPQLAGTGDALYKENFAELIHKASQLTPDDDVFIDISPGVKGNNPLGTNDGHGYGTNPVTGQPYAPNVVRRGDWARVLTEFWADGPSSETPPGHWNVVANAVSDQLAGRKRIAGTGPLLNDLEWDVKLYLALNGAVHDAAIGCWGTKREYDAVRPISAIRYMASHGQSSDPGGPSYDPLGLPLLEDPESHAPLIEVITAATTAPGKRHAALAGYEGEIAIYSWPGGPADPATQHSGVRWIRALTWIPYQKATFVTPAFPGYTSGHSTYSRASAEVLTAFTGSAFFPGGLGEFDAHRGSLTVESGPTADIVFQWASYYDAADDAGLSRQYGGIHPSFDDLPGRIMGSKVGQRAFALAQQYWDGTVAR